VQAYVWDLGFKDMPVDKIVDASRGSRQQGQPTSSEADLSSAISDALFTQPKGVLGPRYCL
jgi:hypothetical protein